MDQISDTTFYIHEVMAKTMEGSIEAPKAMDTFRIGAIASMEALGNINPNYMDPIFLPHGLGCT